MLAGVLNRQIGGSFARRLGVRGGSGLRRHGVGARAWDGGGKEARCIWGPRGVKINQSSRLETPIFAHKVLDPSGIHAQARNSNKIHKNSHIVAVFSPF